MRTQWKINGETSRLEGELWTVGRNSMLAKALPYWGRSATTEIAGSRSYQWTWWNSVGVVSSLSSAIPRSPCGESNRTFTSTFILCLIPRCAVASRPYHHAGPDFSHTCEYSTRDYHTCVRQCWYSTAISISTVDRQSLYGLQSLVQSDIYHQ